MLYYTLSPHCLSHQWRVSLRYTHQHGKNQLKLANWVAGSYMIRDFSRHIMHIQAWYNDAPVSLVQQNKNTWQLPDMAGEYRVEYTVYANDLSVRASLLDNERGFIDGTCLFLYAPDKQNNPCQVCFVDLPNNWQIYTTLPQITEHHYQAKNYAELTDHPFELGRHIEVLHFQAHGINHRIVLSGDYLSFDHERLLHDCKKICEYEMALFGYSAPFSQYLFLLHLGDNIYGGLEHISSTALHADYRSLPAFDMCEASADYIQLLGLIAHEYFHAWNVKTIKPTAFIPYQLDTETYTEQLWAYEGITSYYDDLTLVKSGIISQEAYLNLLAQNITRVYRNAGRKQQTLAQSSFSAWHKYYKQDENSPNAITSYYQQGALMAMCLDLIIRAQSAYSLDTIMCDLYQRARDTGLGTNEGQWQHLAQEITQLDLNDFFQYALYTTEDLPLVACLQSVGLELRFLPQSRTNMGACVSNFPDNTPQADLGCRIKQEKDYAEITHVFSNGSAENAALKPKDKIIAIDGFACTNFMQQTQTQIGRKHVLHFFRNGVLKQTVLTVQASEPTTAYIKIIDKQRLKSWLS